MVLTGHDETERPNRRPPPCHRVGGGNDLRRHDAELAIAGDHGTIPLSGPIYATVAYQIPIRYRCAFVHSTPRCRCELTRRAG